MVPVIVPRSPCASSSVEERNAKNSTSRNEVPLVGYRNLEARRVYSLGVWVSMGTEIDCTEINRQRRAPVLFLLCEDMPRTARRALTRRDGSIVAPEAAIRE